MNKLKLLIITGTLTLLLYAIGELGVISTELYDYTLGVACHFLGGFTITIALMQYLYPDYTINKTMDILFKRHILFFLLIVIALWELFEWIHAVDYHNHLRYVFTGYVVPDSKVVSHVNWYTVVDIVKDVFMSFFGGIVYMRYYYGGE